MPPRAKPNTKSTHKSCKCDRCLAIHPDGQFVHRNTYRAHHRAHNTPSRPHRLQPTIRCNACVEPHDIERRDYEAHRLLANQQTEGDNDHTDDGMYDGLIDDEMVDIDVAEEFEDHELSSAL